MLPPCGHGVQVPRRRLSKRLLHSKVLLEPDNPRVHCPPLFSAAAVGPSPAMLLDQRERPAGRPRCKGSLSPARTPSRPMMQLDPRGHSLPGAGTWGSRLPRSHLRGLQRQRRSAGAVRGGQGTGCSGLGPWLRSGQYPRSAGPWILPRRRPPGSAPRLCCARKPPLQGWSAVPRPGHV